jgi:transposase-like protein
MSGRKGMVHKPLELKLEAVRLFYEEGKTHQQISDALGLPSGESVERWVRRYRREGEQGFCKPIGRPRKVPGEATRIQQLEMENALLKKYHTELRKSLLAKRNIGSSITTEGNTK